MMGNPVVAEVTRGGRIESTHRGAGAVVDADGRVVLAFGDAERPVYPRSAVKALQALPLVESGAAHRLGLSDKEIALSCASHSGSEEHVATARAMLAKAGYDEDVLECGVHWPLGEEEARALARLGRTPTALHNNCSGKHAGFVCLSCDMGVAPKGYVAPDHAVQREVTAAIEGMTGARLSEDMRGVDGCSIPTYAVPLIALARGFARLGTGQGLSPIRRNAVARIRAAVIDAAQAALLEGLRSEDRGRRLQAATFILAQSDAGRRRGWGRRGTLRHAPGEPQTVTIKWIDT
jgi:L-asparaginase II